MNERPVRGIVVGLGSITRAMLSVLAEKPWYETAAVVEVNEEALANAVSQLPDAAAFTDLAQALEQTNADVVLVNTPSVLHYRQCRDALEAGFDVLVAKPITVDFAEAKDLVKLADDRNLTLAVGQQLRYMRHYLAVERFVSAGRLGAVELVNYVNPKPRYGPPTNLDAAMTQPQLHGMSCHHFDALMAVFPDRIPEAVGCVGFQPSWSPGWGGPSMVNAWIRFSDGLNVLYQGGMASRAHNYELRLEGSEGALRCRGLHMSIDEMTNEFAEPGGSFAPLEIDEGIPAADPFHAFFDVWHDYLTKGIEPPFSGRNNLKVFALLSAAIDSAENGGIRVEVAANPEYADAFAEPVTPSRR